MVRTLHVGSVYKLRAQVFRFGCKVSSLEDRWKTGAFVVPGTSAPKASSLKILSCTFGNSAASELCHRSTESAEVGPTNFEKIGALLMEDLPIE